MHTQEKPCTQRSAPLLDQSKTKREGRSYSADWLDEQFIDVTGIRCRCCSRVPSAACGDMHVQNLGLSARRFSPSGYAQSPQSFAASERRLRAGSLAALHTDFYVA